VTFVGVITHPPLACGNETCCAKAVWSIASVTWRRITINIITFFLGTCVGLTMGYEQFLRVET
jgi:hypothetical protein